MARAIDLRSDTVTKPTPEMYEAMAQAALGDDERGEDPTTEHLQALAARMLGKQGALLVPSGTMGNQIALLAHTNHGDVVVVESDSHIYRLESAGITVLAGAMPLPIRGNRGYMKPEEIIEAATRSPKTLHWPEPRLLCVENTHNYHGGAVLTPKQMKEMASAARGSGLLIHLDGARLLNATVSMGIDPPDITEHCDSVMVCLSKGLCAPVGSILAGSKDFIREARRMRKLLGGQMRQAGIISACGVVALTTMVSRLGEDNHKARVLAEKLAESGMVDLDPDTVQTNIIFFSPRGDDAPDPGEFCSRCSRKGVKVGSAPDGRIRAVTHRDVSMAEVVEAAGVLVSALKGR